MCVWEDVTLCVHKWSSPGTSITCLIKEYCEVVLLVQSADRVSQ